ncbi:ABC transporter, putative, partial [Perkinsus marinus ATCC 50983]
MTSQTPTASPEDPIADLRNFRSLSVSGSKINGASLEWTNVDFSIKDKRILIDCTGMVRPGELTAVLGPSGSGKSTLMNVLGGRQSLRGDGRTFDGEISFNGKVQDPFNFRSHIAYVMQDDHLTATATPREILEMSARLRMHDQSKAEVEALVTDLLDSLKLTSCENTVVGNDVIRGISGGERKRTSVGMELISKPQMIFLDEPLSGLDSYAAVTTMKVLKDLARSGVAVVVTVHQPSSEIYSMFDNTLVICSGRMVYLGPTADLKAFIQDSTSKQCPSDYNPADFVLSELQTASEEEIEKLAATYKKKAQARIIPGIKASRAKGDDAPPLKAKSRPSSMTAQLTELFLRDARDTFRNKPVLIARYSVLIILNLLFGCVFFDAGSTQSEDYWLTNVDKFIPYYGGMVTVCISAMMGSAQSTILHFPEQR